MPNLQNFTSNEKSAIVELIKNLTFLLINDNENDQSEKKIQETINKLFFELFEIDEIKLNKLLNKYYVFPLN